MITTTVTISTLEKMAASTKWYQYRELAIAEAFASEKEALRKGQAEKARTFARRATQVKDQGWSRQMIPEIFGPAPASASTEWEIMVYIYAHLCSSYMPTHPPIYGVYTHTQTTTHGTRMCARMCAHMITAHNTQRTTHACINARMYERTQHAR